MRSFAFRPKAIYQWRMSTLFPFEAAAAAAGVTSANIRDWQKRGLLSVPLQPAGRGKTRGYTIENIMEFAVMSEFSRVGIPLSLARGIVGGMKGQITMAARHDFFMWRPSQPSSGSWLRWDQVNGDHLFPLYGQGAGRSAVVVNLRKVFSDVEMVLARFAPRHERDDIAGRQSEKVPLPSE